MLLQIVTLVKPVPESSWADILRMDAKRLQDRDFMKRRLTAFETDGEAPSRHGYVVGETAIIDQPDFEEPKVIFQTRDLIRGNMHQILAAGESNETPQPSAELEAVKRVIEAWESKLDIKPEGFDAPDLADRLQYLMDYMEEEV